MNKIILDFESRSKVDLIKCGAWKYASDPSTDIICASVAINDAPPVLWTREQLYRGPKSLAHADDFLPTSARWVVGAHSVQFEYSMYFFVLHKRYGWPARLDPRLWDCTMARALTCGLPPSLAGAAMALRLPFQKDMEGRSSLLKICKPRKDGTFNESREDYERVYKYCGVDVETERALDKSLPEMTPAERKVFELDLLINARGMAIDVRSCNHAAAVAEGLTDELNARLRKMTGGAVSKASRVAELKRWVAAQGVPVPTREDKDAKPDEEGNLPTKETLDIEAVKDLCKDPAVPQIVKDVVGIRQQVGKSSVAKYQAMIRCVCADGRARGAYQYHGAHTGRFAGKLFQPANFPQGFANEAEQEAAVEMLGQGPDFFRAVYAEKSMQTLSDSLRGMIVPREGCVFVDADLNAIECRVLNWLADEKWVMDLFAAGGSPYIKMAEVIYAKPGLSKKGTPAEYDMGKRTELGCGFGMGWRRFQGNVYTETSKRGEGVEISDELSKRAVKAYRNLHQRVTGFWYETEAAAVNAIVNPGKIFLCGGGRVKWGMSQDRRFLSCQLPSGRLLRYFRPEAKMKIDKFDREKMVLYYWTAAGEGAIRTECMGMLGQYRTWGGELVENVVQAAARDIMVWGMVKAEEAGFKVVLHNYDELCVEMPSSEVFDKENGLGLRRLEECMTEGLPAWTAGCPVKAEGWVGRRYRK